MSDSCTSDATAGCENNLIVSEIAKCCSEQGTKLDTIGGKIDNVVTAITNCCATMESQNNQIIALLQAINNKQ